LLPFPLTLFYLFSIYCLIAPLYLHGKTYIRRHWNIYLTMIFPLKKGYEWERKKERKKERKRKEERKEERMKKICCFTWYFFKIRDKARQSFALPFTKSFFVANENQFSIFQNIGHHLMAISELHIWKVYLGRANVRSSGQQTRLTIGRSWVQILSDARWKWCQSHARIVSCTQSWFIQ